MYKKALGMFAGIDMKPERREVVAQYFSYSLLIADSLTTAVIGHLAEIAATDPSFKMPDVSNPAVIVRTVFEFFGGSIGKDDGLELVLLPEGSESNHPFVENGVKERISRGHLINAMQLMLRVPLTPVMVDGKVSNFEYHKEFFFRDAAGMEKWLAISSTRNWKNSASGMIIL
jgi:hypothetical protein